MSTNFKNLFVTQYVTSDFGERFQRPSFSFSNRSWTDMKTMVVVSAPQNNEVSDELCYKPILVMILKIGIKRGKLLPKIIKYPDERHE